MRKEKVSKKKIRKIIYLEVALVFLIFSFSFPIFIGNVFAEVGENVSVTSNLSIGKSNPNIVSIDIESGSVTLTPNASTIVNCSIIIEDYDGDVDLLHVNATFFDTEVAIASDPDNNNTHYTNTSCVIQTGYGDQYQAKADCLFSVLYYANPSDWNCSVYVEDLSNYTDEDTNDTTIEELLAFGVPGRIDYGTINATYVSIEKEANVTNVGNVKANLSLSGYGLASNDGYAMVCQYGAIQNITVEYQKYNVSGSVPGSLSLGQLEGNYTNLTASPFVEEFNLEYRQGASDITNSTYWRIYVPEGVAGTCNGTVIFGAVKSVVG